MVGCSDICTSYVNQCKINSVSPKGRSMKSIQCDSFSLLSFRLWLSSLLIPEKQSARDVQQRVECGKRRKGNSASNPMKPRFRECQKR